MSGLSTPRIQILPSLLAADMGRLAAEARRAEQAGADQLHLDIMDGHFVPNLSMGPAVVAMAHKTIRIPLSVHLMVTRPDRFAGPFLDAGADTLLIHVEADCDPRPVLRMIRRRGRRAGITLRPGTPARAAEPFLKMIDEILFMTVQPGFGGQAFMPRVLSKIAALRRKAPALDFSVDGGINRMTACAAAEHGANLFIAGTFLFNARNMAAEIRAMREGASRTWGARV